MPSPQDYMTMSGLVTYETQKAVQFRPTERVDAESLGIEFPDGLKFIPRSVCRNGDNLSVGDTDIEVARWWVEKQLA